MRGVAKEVEAMRRDWLLLALTLKGSAHAVDLERFASAGLLHRALADTKTASGSRFDAAVTAAEALIAAAASLESDLGRGTLVIPTKRTQRAASRFIGEDQREATTQVH